MKLSNLVHGRDNNFNLVRIAAAFAVLITHSFALSGEAEPLRKSLGLTFGVIAVDVFFITSGFLVTGSLLTRKSAVEFLWARALRIYPALLVMIVLTVFGLGVLFTSLSLGSYLSNRATYIYLLKNTILIDGVAWVLPGVFESNIAGRAVNGSLWTMPEEIKMYLILVFVWILTRAAPNVRLKVFQFTVVFLAIGAAVTHIFGHLYFPRHFPSEGTITRLFFMFFTGASFYVLKEFIVLSRFVFLLCSIALALSCIEKHAFYVVYSLVIAYMVFFVAYIPDGQVRSYNRVGDYSYGVYIYAFPVQQSVAVLIPDVSVPQMLAVSALVTIALAALSWHLLEQHTLKLKHYYVGHSKRFLAFSVRGISTRRR